jgi:hypothetical protein
MRGMSPLRKLEVYASVLVGIGIVAAGIGFYSPVLTPIFIPIGAVAIAVALIAYPIKWAAEAVVGARSTRETDRP